MTTLARNRRTGGGIALLLWAGLLSASLTTPAAAQGFGWFGNLFGGGAPRQAPASPGSRGYGYAPRSQADSYYDRPRHRTTRRKPVEQVRRDAPPKDKGAEPAKDDASMFVYVLGDNLGELLAVGLDDALSDRQDVGVVQYTRPSSGLASTDHYDWPKAVQDLLAGRSTTGPAPEIKPDPKPEVKADNKPAASAADGTPGGSAAPPADPKIAKPKVDVIVMMLGTNDRQPAIVDGKTLQPGTPDWNAAYTKRVMAIDEAARVRNVPLVWVGIPITKDDNFADAMAALNDIYREAAAKTGAIYVDTWEAFSDDNGNFSSYGPDVNGQTVRLRSADGIFFTKAGARKLAHFVDAHVRRALEGKTPVAQLPTLATPDGRPAADKGGKPIVAARPDAGPIHNLNELPTATSGTLATLARTSPRDADSALRGADAQVPSGRADDAKWSGANGEP